MASPHVEVFYLFDALGAPVAGKAIGPGAAQIHFLTYKNEAGTDVAQPVITEVGGGAYKFTPVFADTTHGITYIVSTGGSNPITWSRYMRPEDWNDDLATTGSSILKKLARLFGV